MSHAVAGPRIREAGDAALLLELEPRIDDEVNARAIAIAAALRSAAVPAVRDVVNCFRSVAVYFDPLAVDASTIADAMRLAWRQPVLERPPSTAIEVPTVYGGEGGPDLDGVAAASGLTPVAVAERHMAATYRVFMLGFLPGFAYMGLVDPAIAVPRRATPRVRVPRGSVAIAGRQTGVYPRESPGGWQVIGSSALDPFDPSRVPSTVFQPGDSVRFVRARHRPTPRATPPVRPLETQGGGIVVLEPGLFTTVQDLGRWGHQRLGVPVSGPMDAWSFGLANRLVGNDRGMAALEATVRGPSLRLEEPVVVAVAGADLNVTLDGEAIAPGQARACRAGAILRSGARANGARTYLAFRGGLAVRPVLGSCATHVVAGLGGLHGRRLSTGDRIPLGRSGSAVEAPPARASNRRPRMPEGGARLRVMPGPQDDWFDPHAFERLQRSRYVVSGQSDRMGYRLQGPAIPRRSRDEMISDATFTGGLQVPPSGDPILLMADRQTTGGYPQMATVISADLPLAGQLAPGDWVEFQLATRREAVAALRDVQEMLDVR